MAFLDRFRREFAERFGAAVHALEGSIDPFAGEPSRDELAAMRTNVLESEVAIGKLAALVKQHAPAELAELSARFATLFRRSVVDDGDNPIGPLAIALKRVTSGIEAAGLDPEGREAVLEELMARHRDILHPHARG